MEKSAESVVRGGEEEGRCLAVWLIVQCDDGFVDRVRGFSCRFWRIGPVRAMQESR